MKITRIIEQEKRKGRYSIFVDGKYAFSLSEGTLLESKLAGGQELTNERLKEWQRRSSEDKLYSNALRYAVMRLRSSWEMEQYLKRRDTSPALTEQILNKLSNIGLLNDVEFAQSWVSNRRLLRPSSKLKLQHELRAKRVDEAIIGQILQEDGGDEQAALHQLVVKKRSLSKYKKDPRKLMQYLARQGFSYDDIKNELGSIG